MSANIYWQPVSGRPLPVNCPSSFLAALRNAFGGKTDELAAGDIPVLRGLWAGLTSDREAVDQLIQAIEHHKSIRVWAVT